MKLIRLAAGIIAAITAMTTLSSNSTVLSTTSNVFAEEDTILPELPDWIPTDLDSAIDFQNTYGATHADSGFICVVHKSGNPQLSPHFEVNGKNEEYDDSFITSQIYYLYPEALDAPYLMVSVFRPVESGKLTISYTNYLEQIDYTFETDSAMNITETDIYGWLPDSMTEYSEYTRDNGEVSVKDHYLVFCLRSIEQFGEKWEPDINCNYDKLKYLMSSDCTMQVPELYDDGSIDKIYVYQAVKDGYEKISWVRSSYERPDQSEPTTYTVTAECEVLDDAKTVLLPGDTKVSLIDYETGVPVVYDHTSASELGCMLFRECDLGDAYVENPSIVDLECNPSIVNYKDLSKDHEYSFHIENVSKVLKNYTNLSEEASITRYDNNSYNLIFKLKFTPTGDVNDDGEFNVADAVLLQKWLLAVPDTILSNWKASDFCNDNVLDSFDLCLMKQKLITQKLISYVEPDERYSYGFPFYVIEDGLKLYVGPDESYDVIDSIPADIRLLDSGRQINNNTWLFTEYNGQFGWINVYGSDGEMTVVFMDQPAKPVIYLYPENETDVHVELELTESDLNTTYPKYDNGWDVTAYPDGTLINISDGSRHRYLFWDAVNCSTKFDFSTGFCVPGYDTERFLKEKLTYMGLTEEEMNEFIVYWLPLMEHNKYNLISFQHDAYINSAKLTITPQPDSELRIFMAYVPLTDSVDIEPQQLVTFTRKGFSLVEWGGVEINSFNL